MMKELDFSLYNFYTGTSTGSLIYVCDKPNNLKCARNDVVSQITALESKSKDQILLGYENGIVQVFDTLEKKFTKKINDLEGEGPVVGLGIVNKTTVIPKRDGIINLHRKKKNNYFDINLDQKGSLEATSVRGNVLGTGGEHNDFKLWDLETFQCSFKAKSLGHDMLNLPIPTSVKGIAFLPDSENLDICCTKEGHVLLYDTRAQRRPVVKFFEKQASYTTITCTHKEMQCLVGTTRGYMQLLDMKMGKCLKTFKGFTGSVTSIFCDASQQPFVATTSLDRFLRIHNLETKELLHKIYLKQNLTKLIVQAVVKEEKEDNDIIEEEIDYIEVKKKRKTTENQDRKKSKMKKVKRSAEIVEF